MMFHLRRSHKVDYTEPLRNCFDFTSVFVLALTCMNLLNIHILGHPKISMLCVLSFVFVEIAKCTAEL